MEREGILEIINYVIQKLYIYCHMKSNVDETPEEKAEDLRFDIAIMSIIIIMLSFSIVKVLLIFIHFFIINTMINLAKFFYRLIKKKCCINLIQELKYSYFYFVKIFKKFYTNNFYSYENKYFGGFFVLIYILFILFNFFFTLDYVVIDAKDESKNKILRSLQIISFELNIIMELICCTFFIYRCFKKQFMIIIASYLMLNMIVILVIYYRILNNMEEKENFDKSIYIARLTFLSFFSSLALYSVKIISDYDLNCM